MSSSADVVAARTGSESRVYWRWVEQSEGCEGTTNGIERCLLLGERCEVGGREAEREELAAGCAAAPSSAPPAATSAASSSAARHADAEEKRDREGIGAESERFLSCSPTPPPSPHPPRHVHRSRQVPRRRQS